MVPLNETWSGEVPDRDVSMSPTILRQDGFRFYFFSREEMRVHVHMQCSDGEAKYWLEPAVELAHNHGLDERQLRLAKAIVEAWADDIRKSWKQHFGG